MIPEKDTKQTVADLLMKDGFRLSRDRSFGDKWVADLSREDKHSITLIELKMGAPVATIDVSDANQERKAIKKSTKKDVHSIILNIGDFELPAESQILDVARAAGVEVIHGKTVQEALPMVEKHLVTDA